jgi:hypothetical protein
LVVAAVAMIAVIEPEIDTTAFLTAMAVLGVGMGLLASQLGNVVQSAVGAADRSEVGGLQYTSQQLGAALGTALMGAVVIGGLAGAFLSTVEADPRVSEATTEQVGIELEAGVSFVSVDQVQAGAEEAGLPPDEVAALTEGYADTQLQALKAGLLLAAFLAAAALAFTSNLPRTQPEGEDDGSSVAPSDDLVGRSGASAS